MYFKAHKLLDFLAMLDYAQILRCFSACIVQSVHLGTCHVTCLRHPTHGTALGRAAVHMTNRALSLGALFLGALLWALLSKNVGTKFQELGNNMLIIDNNNHVGTMCHKIEQQLLDMLEILDK